VTDLNKNDFEILDNGKRQEISYFAHQADVPLNVALLVDVSGSVLQIIEVEKGNGRTVFGTGSSATR
jgi:hypothetical protein